MPLPHHEIPGIDSSPVIDSAPGTCVPLGRGASRDFGAVGYTVAARSVMHLLVVWTVTDLVLIQTQTFPETGRHQVVNALHPVVNALHRAAG